MTTKQIPTLNDTGGVFGVIKKAGETPLQCLDRLRVEHPEFENETLSYAGRLDPLATGLLLILAGEKANKERNDYLGLTKTYEVEVLFGFSTDSYDILGLVENSQQYDSTELIESVKNNSVDVSNFSLMDYPVFASKPVNGKSLFQWAREGRLSEIEIPKQKGKTVSIELLKSEVISSENIKSKIHKLVQSVSGDFRQEQILTKWNECFDANTMKELLVVKFKIECESGVYMRSIAHKLGQLVGVPAVALTIHRTKVGNFDIESVLK